MSIDTTSRDWPTFVSCLERALDCYDADPSTYGDELRMPTELFLDAPVTPLPVALRDQAIALQARVDRVVTQVQTDMERVLARLGASHDGNDERAPIYIDERF
jgi:hypothetical protein